MSASPPLMLQWLRRALAVTCFMLLASSSCAGDESEPEGPVYDPAEWFTHEVGPFTVPAATETYLCFSTTLTEDVVASELRFESHPVVHHVIYSRTNSPDPDGMHECDTLLSDNWEPLFIAGTGDAALDVPDGAGFVLEAGTQLTMQLHLLNATSEDITETVNLRMRRAAGEVTPVHLAWFGTAEIEIPAANQTDVVGDCKTPEDMELFAGFAHMHLLGTKMVVEAGPTLDQMDEIFRADPYDFDNQTLASLSLSLEQGTQVRVTCSYDNPGAEAVAFGDSSFDEMCFFFGFVTGTTSPQTFCIDGGESSVPETCGNDAPNDIGLGASCTGGGGECESGLQCTQDLPPGPLSDVGLCIGVGCQASADCGDGGAVCCPLTNLGVSVCLPQGCVLPECGSAP